MRSYWENLQQNIEATEKLLQGDFKEFYEKMSVLEEKAKTHLHPDQLKWKEWSARQLIWCVFDKIPTRYGLIQNMVVEKLDFVERKLLRK